MMYIKENHSQIQKLYVFSMNFCFIQLFNVIGGSGGGGGVVELSFCMEGEVDFKKYLLLYTFIVKVDGTHIFKKKKKS